MKGEHNVFSFLDVKDLKELCGFFQCRSLRAGETLWEEGSPCDYMAFVVSGRVEVKKQTEFRGRHVVVGIFSKGSIIGSLCILDNAPRAVTAVALEDVTIVTLSRDNFEKLMSAYPESGSKLMRGMLLSTSVRLRKSFERLAKIF
jgi:CRP-like cAMP-binding protein